jgi:hypothetical protein
MKTTEETESLIANLRALSRYENDDLSLANDAADLIESMAIETAKLRKAIADIAPWLSASLESMTPCQEYREACEQVFLADVHNRNG